jgi:rRNA maturation endonuclease Nob1
MKKSLWTRFLIATGFRSACHGAKIYAWSLNKHYCDECGGKLNF